MGILAGTRRMMRFVALVVVGCEMVVPALSQSVNTSGTRLVVDVVASNETYVNFSTTYKVALIAPFTNSLNNTPDVYVPPEDEHLQWLPTAAAMAVACDDFNARDGNVLSEFGQLGECTVGLECSFINSDTDAVTALNLVNSNPGPGGALGTDFDAIVGGANRRATGPLPSAVSTSGPLSLVGCVWGALAEVSRPARAPLRSRPRGEIGAWSPRLSGLTSDAALSRAAQVRDVDGRAVRRPLRAADDDVRRPETRWREGPHSPSPPATRATRLP